MAVNRNEVRYSDLKCDLSGICIKFPGIGAYVRIGDRLGGGAYGDVFSGHLVQEPTDPSIIKCDDAKGCKRRNVLAGRNGANADKGAFWYNGVNCSEESDSDTSKHYSEFKGRIDTAYAESCMDDTATEEYPDYAIKYFKDDTVQFMEEGFCPGTLRELSIMKSCNDHPNIIKLVDVYVGTHPGIASLLDKQFREMINNSNGKVVGRNDSNMYPFKSSQIFVLALYEYCKGGDLGRKIFRMNAKGHGGFSLEEVKWYAYQLLNGLAYLHMSKIEHRDLKPNNIMLADNRRLTVLKIGDWGMSREFRNMDGSTTPTACTMFYRPIEVILGSLPLLDTKSTKPLGTTPVRRYSYGINVDSWGAGCIIAELVTWQPLFHGNSDFQVLTRIVTTLGRPTEEEWRNCSKSEHYPFNGSLYNITVKDKKERLRQVLKGRMDSLGIDLLLSLLQYNPHKRISAIEALSHPWFHDIDFRKLDALGVRNCLGNAMMGMLGAGTVRAMESRSECITSTTLLPHLLFTESKAKEQVIDAIDRDHSSLEVSLRQPALPIVVQYHNTSPTQ